MKIETLNKGNELATRYGDLKQQKQSLEKIKGYGNTYIPFFRNGNGDSVNLLTVDPSRELYKTILLVVGAKIDEEMARCDKEFEALQDGEEAGQ